MIYLSIFTGKPTFLIMIFFTIILATLISLLFATRKQIVPLFITILLIITTIGIFKLIYPNLYYWKISEYDKSEMWDLLNVKYCLIWIVILFICWKLIYNLLNRYIEVLCKDVIYKNIEKGINEVKKNPKNYKKYKNNAFANFIKGYNIGQKYRFNKAHTENEIIKEDEDPFDSIFDEIRRLTTISVNMIICCLLFIRHEIAFPILIGSVLFFLINLIVVWVLAKINILSSENE